MFSERFPSFTLNAHNTLRQYINMLILQKNLINHRQLYIKQLYYYPLVAPVNIFCQQCDDCFTTSLQVYWLSCSSQVRQIMGWDPSQLKPMAIKLVFPTSPPNTQSLEQGLVCSESEKNVRLKRRVYPPTVVSVSQNYTNPQTDRI